MIELSKDEERSRLEKLAYDTISTECDWTVEYYEDRGGIWTFDVLFPERLDLGDLHWYKAIHGGKMFLSELRHLEIHLRQEFAILNDSTLLEMARRNAELQLVLRSPKL